MITAPLLPLRNQPSQFLGPFGLQVLILATGTRAHEQDRLVRVFCPSGHHGLEMSIDTDWYYQSAQGYLLETFKSTSKNKMIKMDIVSW